MRKIPPECALKPKDLVGTPWRVAFALQADGWWLRSDIVWAKPNPMPESITDRPTRSHEYLFLLTKSARYFYDSDAIREPHTWNGQNYYADQTQQRTIRGFDTRPAIPGERERRSKTAGEGPHAGGRRQAPEPGEEGAFHPLGRNKRSVWTIATQPYRGAHFATFPEDLVRPCILAGCPKGGLVMDPFAGSGTVGKVAIELGRSAVLADIEYTEQARKRTAVLQRPLI
jgi:DNA modification methylase